MTMMMATSVVETAFLLSFFNGSREHVALFESSVVEGTRIVR